MKGLWRWLGWFQQETHPALQQNAALFDHIDPDRPIEECEFLAFDTELTGLNLRRDEIVSIGAVRIRGLRIEAGDNFFAYVRPGRDLPKDSTLIHRITPEQIKNAPPVEEILPDFVEYCGGSLLIGHFVALDMAFVNRALQKHLGGTLHNPTVDTMKLAAALHELRRHAGQAKFDTDAAYNLNKLARRFGLPIFEQHDALEDAVQTAYLFLFLIKQLRSAGYHKLRDVFDPNKAGPRVM